MSVAFRVWWKQDDIAISSLKSCDFPPILFSSLFKCKLVLACFEWNYLLCPSVLGGWYWAGMSFVTPEWCINDVLSSCTRMSHGKYCSLQRLACFSSLVLNFVFRLLKEALESLWSEVCVRLVEGQTLPIIAGFSECLPGVVFLSW